jgi:hypothetical protein
MKKRILTTILTLAMISSIFTGITFTAFAEQTVTAAPSKTKVMVNGVPKTFEAYTINGSDYYKLKDLGLALWGTGNQLGVGYDALHKAWLLDVTPSEEPPDGTLVKGDGVAKKAILITPKVYFKNHEVHLTAYTINGNDYYKLEDIMALVDCGVIRNKTTGVINLDSSKLYEPEFPPIPKGNPLYMQVQQSLYDAYFKYPGNEWDGGKDDCYFKLETNVTVPDNATLYVPKGVIFDDFRTIFLGNNSNYVVRGKWFSENPDVRPVSSKTKNALYTDLHSTEDRLNAQEEVVIVDGGKYARVALPLSTASISYGAALSGVQPIKLNFERDKRDVVKGLYVNIHVKNGTSYGYFYENVSKSLDLMPQLLNTIGKNIGKNVTIDKIEVQNANYIHWFNAVVKSKVYSIPVNWSIVTSGNAPTIEKKAEFGNYALEIADLKFFGLSKDTYIVRYLNENLEQDRNENHNEQVKEIVYGLASPENNYTLMKLPFENEIILGDRANIGLLKGKTGSSPNSYAFTVSPLSSDIMYAGNYRFYPTEASLQLEKDKTYMNFKYGNKAGEVSESNYDAIMVRYHKKGDPEDTQGVLFTGTVDVKTGKIDLTSSLATLKNQKGSMSIDKLYVHVYANLDIYDDKNIPSLQFVEVPCDITTN